MVIEIIYRIFFNYVGMYILGKYLVLYLRKEMFFCFFIIGSYEQIFGNFKYINSVRCKYFENNLVKSLS